MKTDRKNKRYS